MTCLPPAKLPGQSVAEACIDSYSLVSGFAPSLTVAKDDAAPPKLQFL